MNKRYNIYDILEVGEGWFEYATTPEEISRVRYKITRSNKQLAPKRFRSYKVKHKEQFGFMVERYE